MSKTLNTLLKIAQKKLDDQTQVLAEVTNQKQDFINEKDFLTKNIEKSINSAKDDSFDFLMAHNYAAKAKLGIVYIEDQLVKINQKIEQETNILKELFLEKKRTEIMLENYNKKRKSAINKKIQVQADDFNTIAYINKNN